MHAMLLKIESVNILKSLKFCILIFFFVDDLIVLSSVMYHISGIVHERKLLRYVDCHSDLEKIFANLVMQLQS